MPSSGPIARLQQLASALTSPGSLLGGGEASHTTFVNEHRNKFEPGLPAGLPVNHTPLNPVSFLLRSATIRPNRVALQHHDLGVQWTYAEWSVQSSESQENAVDMVGRQGYANLRIGIWPEATRSESRRQSMHHLPQRSHDTRLHPSAPRNPRNNGAHEHPAHQT
jgi:hypothetical protein